MKNILLISGHTEPGKAIANRAILKELNSITGIAIHELPGRIRDMNSMSKKNRKNYNGRRVKTRLKNNSPKGVAGFILTSGNAHLSHYFPNAALHDEPGQFAPGFCTRIYSGQETAGRKKKAGKGN
jgi:hypothetical protein